MKKIVLILLACGGLLTSCQSFADWLLEDYDHASKKRGRGERMTCYVCDGSGYMFVRVGSRPCSGHSQWRNNDCPNCDGSGIVYSRKGVTCSLCDGAGIIHNPR